MSLYRIKEANDGAIPGRHTGEQHVYLLRKVVGVKYCNRNPNTIFQMDRMMLKPIKGIFPWSVPSCRTTYQNVWQPYISAHSKKTHIINTYCGNQTVHGTNNTNL